jgi:sigma-B regulation protein RsbU (phosphoserine phosphatase)
VEYHDLLKSPEYAGIEAVRRLGLRSGVIAALAVKGNITGFVAAFRCQPGGFARQLVKVLPGLAELAAIAIENARLYQRQVDIAHLTQKNLVPLSLQNIPGFDMGYKYAPAYQVGGDYCDIIKLQDGKYGIAIADVAGKDIKAASHIGMCRHSLRAVADEIKSPAVLMKKMNSCVCEHTEPDSFISMIYAVLDPASRRLTLSSAGHEPAVVFRKRSTCLEELSTYGLLLGILPHETYSQRRTCIRAGDILMLYTDGLVDALSSRDIPGDEKMKNILLDCHMQPMQQIADTLHDHASAHTARNPDDIALILLKAL